MVARREADRVPRAGREDGGGREKEKDKDDAQVADKDDKRARFWLLHVATGETRALTKPTGISRGRLGCRAGDELIVKATDHPESDEYTERIFTVQVSDGAMKQLVAPRGRSARLRVAPDGKTMSYVGSREDGRSRTIAAAAGERRMRRGI